MLVPNGAATFFTGGMTSAASGPPKSALRSRTQ